MEGLVLERFWGAEEPWCVREDFVDVKVVVKCPEIWSTMRTSKVFYTWYR